MPTTVTFTVPISAPTLNPTAVELQRVDQDGNVLSVSRMYDNGRNGDSLPGDRIFSAAVPLEESSAVSMHYRVAAAFRGNQKAEMSDTVTLDVWTPVQDGSSGLTLTIPPLPAPAVFVAHDVHGERSVDIQLLDQATDRYTSVVRIPLHSNPERLELLEWFAQSIDPAGFLLPTGVYVERRFSTGVVALVQVTPLPDGFLATEGPIETIFATVPGSTVVLGLFQAQDVTLGDFGFSDAVAQEFLQNIAGNIFK